MAKELRDLKKLLDLTTYTDSLGFQAPISAYAGFATVRTVPGFWPGQIGTRVGVQFRGWRRNTSFVAKKPQTRINPRGAIMEDIKEVALRVARELCSEGHSAIPFTTAEKFASRLLAELQKDAQPVAWMREWEGDESDLGHMMFETDEADLDNNPNWVPLFHLPQPKAVEEPDTEALHIAYMMGHAKGREQAQPKAATVPRDLVELLRQIRPEFGAVGSRDVDVRRQQEQIDTAIAMLEAANSLPAQSEGEQK